LEALIEFPHFQPLVQISKNRARFFPIALCQKPLASAVLGRSQPWAGAIPKAEVMANLTRTIK
jgi:hypothetical protein